MGLLRNFIDISGITPEGDLPDKIKGQLLEYSEIEYFYIPEDKPAINSIYQISVKVELLSTRAINAPLGKIVVLDGVKKVKIVYTEFGENGAVSALDIELPFNTFIDIPKENGDIDKVNIFIADAYFKKIDNRKLYSFILYIIDVSYDKSSNSINVLRSDNIGTFNHCKDAFDEEPDIKITSQALNEISLSKIHNKIDKNYEDLDDLLIDINSEYL